ncbi:MAG: VanW family protein [Clostridium sp.]|nr:VanW family protein [Clostridium sp.]
MKKKNLAVAAITCFVVAIIGISIPVYNVYSKVKSFDNYIYPGVTIKGIDVSGKTTVEAKKLISDKFQVPIGNKKLNVKVNNRNYTITYGQMSAKYEIDKAVQEAFSYGRNESVLKKYNLIKKPAEKNIDLVFSYDSKPVDNLINSIKTDVNKDPVNATIKKSGAGFQITQDSVGYKLRDTELKSKILAAINGDTNNDTNVEAAVDTVQAKQTASALSTINTQISTFSTSFGSISSPQRVTNITLATNAINGIVLMPGDTFSFNGVVGQRTAAKGYQSAPVDIGNTTGMGLGGGICQVSTTLYNAVLLAGVKATVRVHHTIPSAYVPLGFDATVDYGNLDYQFKNTLNFPMYIEGSSANGTETFNIYSNSSLTSNSYKVVNNVSPDGKNVKVYLQTYANGTMTNNTMIANDTYK